MSAGFSSDCFSPFTKTLQSLADIAASFGARTATWTKRPFHGGSEAASWGSTAVIATFAGLGVESGGEPDEPQAARTPAATTTASAASARTTERGPRASPSAHAWGDLLRAHVTTKPATRRPHDLSPADPQVRDHRSISRAARDFVLRRAAQRSRSPRKVRAGPTTPRRWSRDERSGEDVASAPGSAGWPPAPPARPPAARRPRPRCASPGLKGRSLRRSRRA